VRLPASGLECRRESLPAGWAGQKFGHSGARQ
jgi:hypothetical protein